MRSGFGLVEIAVLLAVIGVIISSLLPAVSMRRSLDEVNVTIERMKRIEDALKAFNNAATVRPFLPCPAPMNLHHDNSAFGVMTTHNNTTPPGTCTGAQDNKTGTPAGVSFGAVPVRSLGLPEEYAFDGYGRLISYHVSLPTISNGTVSGITVQNAATTPVVETTTAAYALISHGKNGHGAYLRGGARTSSGSINTAELQNCDCTSTAAVNNYATNGHIMVRDVLIGEDTARFDDIVRYSPIP